MNDIELVLREVERLEERERFREAFDLVVTACSAHREDETLWATRGDLALLCGLPEEAVTAFSELLRLQPDDAEGWFALGEAHQFAGRNDLAEPCFARAASLEPDRHVVPVRVTAARFEEVTGAVLRTLPREVVAHLDATGTTVTVLPHPGLELVAGDHLDPHALGYWRGNPFGVPGSGLGGGETGAAIEIYQLNIENWCADEARLEEEIRRTVLHEVGHALGMDHDLLDEDGY